MRIFKTKVFARFASKEGLSDDQLRETVAEAETSPDAPLGGGLFKQRVARSGGGKSGGYRTILFLRHGERAIFAYGFAKKDAANITSKHKKVLKKLAAEMLGYSDDQVAEAVETGELMEVQHAEESAREGREEA